MHVNFATRIAAESFAERSLSLLTMRNKAFMQQSGHTDTLTLVKYIVHDTQLSFLRRPYSVIDRFACTSLKKNVFEFEISNANASRFAPCRIRLKICSGALFWNYPGYSCSGLGITEYI